MEDIYSRVEGKNTPTVEEALGQISEQDLKENKWPLLVKVNKGTFRNYNGRFDVPTEERKRKRELDFWKEIFNKENFLTPDTTKFNPEEDFLFILHSKEGSDGMDTEFIAVTTTYQSFIEDPINMINYDRHGRPCSVRSHGSYPRRDFWKFYDEITQEEQDQYAIPDSKWREHYYTEGTKN